MSDSKENKTISRRQLCRRSDKTGIFLTVRQTSWFVSSFILICFFVFISGYFLGKKKAVEKFYHKIKQDSFSDHIYYSMCSMYDKQDEQLGGDGGIEVQSTDVELADADAKEQKTTTKLQGSEVAVRDAVDAGARSELAVEERCQYYAELIGFGTERAARRFADKLLKNNVTVSVKRRRSKTARGRVITWYQVITGTFDDKDDLIAFVDDISARERLKDVRIVSC